MLWKLTYTEIWRDKDVRTKGDEEDDGGPESSKVWRHWLFSGVVLDNWQDEDADQSPSHRPSRS